MRLILILASIVLFSSCTPKRTSEKESAVKQDGTTFNLDGEYEYYAGSSGEVYVYHKLSLKRNGDEITGSLFTGHYLSQNDQGYTMPSATITSTITCQVSGRDELMLYLGAVSDSSRMEKTSAIPNQLTIFGENAQGDPVQSITKLGNDYVWVINGDTLVFTPVKPQ